MGRILNSLIVPIARAIVRTSGFLRKDVVDFVRQPRLLLALVLGPFLILLLFGLGFSSEPISLRTVVVIGDDNPLRPYVEKNAENLVKQLILVDIVESESFARHQLVRNRVDVIIVVPDDVQEKLRSNQQAAFTTLHNTIDPMRANYVRAFTNVYVNEANRRAQLTAIRQAQAETAGVEPDIVATRKEAASLRRAIEQGDEEAAQEEMSQLRRSLALVQAGLGPAEWLIAGLGEILSMPGTAGRRIEPQVLLAEIEEVLQVLGDVEPDRLISEENLERVSQLEEDLLRLESAMEQFHRTDPDVLVSPFVGENQTVGQFELDLSDYYIPATVSLLLQHLCVTFGALSIVRERQTGTVELFRASPIAAIEVLIGKYLGYWLAAALVASMLTGLLLLIMQVPMLGHWGDYTATLATLMFTSLGLGFVISMLARSISQAVQYAMIALLASVFFSGFFISLELLRWGVRIVSWFIPATYGIRLLQDIMLRGLSFQLWEVLILAGMGLAFFFLAWVGLRRELSRK